MIVVVFIVCFGIVIDVTVIILLVSFLHDIHCTATIEVIGITNFDAIIVPPTCFGTGNLKYILLFR